MIINNINKQERKESRTNVHGGLNEKKRGEIERNFSLSLFFSAFSPNSRVTSRPTNNFPNQRIIFIHTCVKFPKNFNASTFQLTN